MFVCLLFNSSNYSNVRLLQYEPMGQTSTCSWKTVKTFGNIPLTFQTLSMEIHLILKQSQPTTQHLDFTTLMPPSPMWLHWLTATFSLVSYWHTFRRYIIYYVFLLYPVHSSHINTWIDMLVKEWLPFSRSFKCISAYTWSANSHHVWNPKL